MKRWVCSFLLIVVLVSHALAGERHIPLSAGTARVDITPQALLPMAGYPNRTCPAATGKLGPLFAKALVLSAGESRIALVTVDLISFVSDKLRSDVAARLGIPVLLVASSHTHSGPSLPKSPGLQREIERKIFRAVQEAAGAMFPARPSAGRGSIQLGYNRLIPGEDGRSEALFINRDAVPYGPVDPEFTLLRIEDERGAARVIVVHYACHSVVLGPSNCRYSADYPGILQEKVEAQMSGVQCMFVQGGAGDINPILLGRSPDDEQNQAAAIRVGEVLAREVLRAARRIGPGGPNRHPILSTSEVLSFSNRREKGRSLRVGITTVLLNGDIAIAAVPGEPMHRLQTAWKANAEVAYPLFWGYTYSAGGEWPGYIPDLRSAARGGYGADSRIEIGAGETIIQHHLKNLYGLQGRWQQPGSEK